MKNTYKMKRESLIVAAVIVSESELLHIPYYEKNMHNSNEIQFKNILYDLGMDTTRAFAKQEGLIHRNRLNQVVKCTRWVGEERQDYLWIESGYASQEAKDKYTGNKLLEDSYRIRMLTSDAQAMLEDKDRYTIIDETVWF